MIDPIAPAGVFRISSVIKFGIYNCSVKNEVIPNFPKGNRVNKYNKKYINCGLKNSLTSPKAFFKLVRHEKCVLEIVP